LLVCIAVGCGSQQRAAHPLTAPLVGAGSRPGIDAIQPSDLLIEPDAGVRPLVRLIDRAQSRIFVEDYILTDRGIIRALERAAAQGVQVDVLLEPHPLGMGTQPQRLAEQLRAAGITVRWSPSRYALTHAKMMVLDDRAAIISTANFSRSGFTSDRDAAVVDRRGADVRSLSNIFRADWDDIPTRRVAGDLVVSPDTARPMIEGLVRRARRRLDVYAEELVDSRMARLFSAAARRGVRVRIILPAPPSVDGLRGVAIRRLRSPYAHAKVIVVDSRVAFVGSENLSAQSLDRNREIGVLIRGRRIGQLSTVFDRDWRRAAG
jgi:cardiolipin synthase